MRLRVHTPGPWRLLDRTLRKTRDGEVHDWRASIIRDTDQLTNGYFIATVDQAGSRDYANALANAEMMAAAPQAFELLEKIIDRIGYTSKDIDEARALIESVRGIK